MMTASHGSRRIDSAGSATIVVIDDDAYIRRAVSGALSGRGYRLIEAATGLLGIDLAAKEQPAVVILDLGLPDVAGIEVCRELRSWTRAPIIILSARHSEEEKVDLLNAGADDYITKPFGLRELEARVAVQLRRFNELPERQRLATLHVDADGLEIDFAGHRITRGDCEIHLTPVEWRLLAVLAADAGRTLTHRQIFDSVWGRQFGNLQQHLRVHITHLRRKIERDASFPALIVTEPGVGYRFQMLSGVEDDAR